MARTVRDAAIGTRESRLKLKVGRRYWRGIHEGLALCYRRGRQGSGSWSARLMLSNGTYALRHLGVADDHAEANGVDVLTFAHAQAMAIAKGEAAKRDEGIIVTPITVREAADRYLAWFRKERRSAHETEAAIKAHILPDLGDRRVSALKADALREWLEKVGNSPARLRAGKLATQPAFRDPPKTDDEKRARRATANRVFTVLRAILNKAFQDGRVTDNAEWRRVKPFAKVDEARIRFLDDAEAVRLVNACPPDLRRLVRAALLTGTRFGEISSMTAQDVDLRGTQVYVSRSKSGRPRYVPLNPEGVAHFSDAAKGKAGDALLFTKKDGGAWGKNHHVKALNAACAVAKITPAVSFHELRHTYASMLINNGVELPVIAKLLGHADTRITLRHYAHLADKVLKAAVTNLPSFEPDKSAVLTVVKGERAKRKAVAK